MNHYEPFSTSKNLNLFENYWIFLLKNQLFKSTTQNLTQPFVINAQINNQNNSISSLLNFPSLIPKNTNFFLKYFQQTNLQINSLNNYLFSNINEQITGRSIVVF